MFSGKGYEKELESVFGLNLKIFGFEGEKTAGCISSQFETDVLLLSKKGKIEEKWNELRGKIW